MEKQHEFERLVQDLNRAKGQMMDQTCLIEIARRAIDLIPSLRPEDREKIVGIALDIRSHAEELSDAAAEFSDTIDAADDEAEHEWPDFLAAKEIEVNVVELRKKEDARPASDQSQST